MEFKSITDFNKHLVRSAERITALEYLREYNQIESGLDLAFATKLHEYVRRTDCCVPQELLVEFGVSSRTGWDVVQMLGRNGFKQD